MSNLHGSLAYTSTTDEQLFERLRAVVSETIALAYAISGTLPEDDLEFSRIVTHRTKKRNARGANTRRFPIRTGLVPMWR